MKSIANGASFANGNGANGQAGTAVGLHNSPARSPGDSNWEQSDVRTTFWELI